MKEGGTVGDREERRERKSRDGGETEGLSERDLRRIMMEDLEMIRTTSSF